MSHSTRIYASLAEYFQYTRCRFFHKYLILHYGSGVSGKVRKTTQKKRGNDEETEWNILGRIERIIIQGETTSRLSCCAVDGVDILHILELGGMHRDRVRNQTNRLMKTRKQQS